MTTLPDPGFADDAGSVDPAVADALAAYHDDGDPAPVLVALSSSRLLVPVVAIPTEVEADARGLAHDKQSDIAAVLMRGRDGRKALLAFTGLAALQTWDPQARPVPVSTQDAAASALQEGAAALLVDVAGPVMYVVDTPDLEQFAQGRALAPTAAGYAWLSH